jgi:hypothetical protein
MGSDSALPTIVQQLNRVHHEDEARHIAAGRQIVKHIYARLAKRLDGAARNQLDLYLRRYVGTCLESLYNPTVYRDAGIADPYVFRTEVLGDPARKACHRKFLGRTVQFFSNNGMVSDPAFLG